MRFTSWILMLAATGILAVLAVSLFLKGERTPGGMLVEAQELIQQGGYDERQVQDRLDQALALAATARDAELCTRILKTRANLYRDLGAIKKARQDLSLILTMWSPGNRTVQEQLIELDIATGEYDLGIERIRELIDEAPEHGRFLSLAGELNWRVAARKRRELESVLEEVFVASELDKALELARRIAFRDPEDPLRAPYAYKLRRLFPTGDDPRISVVLNLLESISRDYATSRQHYAKGLAYQIDAQAVGALLEIMLGVDHHEEAIDLGRFAFRFEEIWREERPCLSYLKALNRRGHLNPAATIAYHGVRPDLALPFSSDFFVEANEALYLAAVYIKGGSWNAVRSAGNLLGVSAETLEQRRHGSAYMALGQHGVSLSGADPIEKAILRLTKYLSSQSEPFHGSRFLAYMHLAKLYRSLKDVPHERESLSAANHAYLELEREGVELDERVLVQVELADLWERLAELQLGAQHGGYDQPLENLARAIEAAPERADELLPRWEELGATYLEILGIDIDFQVRNMRDRDDWLPARATAPFEMYALAKAYRDTWNEPFGVSRACKRFRVDFPDFLPVIEMALEADLALENYDSVAELIIRRTELIGTDEDTRRILTAVPYRYISGDRRLRLMRADPEGVGRTVLLRRLLSDGHPERAYEVLGQMDRADLNEAQLEILTGLEARMGKLGANASEQGGTLPVLHGNEDSEFLGQALRTHLKRPGPFQGSELVRILAGRELPFLQRMVLASDLLMSHRPIEALALLPKPGSAPTHARGKVLLAYAVANSQLEQIDKMTQALGRAEAFDAEVSATLGRLFLGAQQRRWRDVTASVEELYRSDFQGTPLQNWILEVLLTRPAEAPQKVGADFKHDEHLEALAQCATSAYAGRPLDPPSFFGERATEELEGFILGQRGSRDPREALCLLLALENDVWRPWAISQLAHMDADETGRLWPAFLEGVALENAGFYERSGERFNDLRLYANDFGPAWRLYLAYRERQLGDPYHPDLLVERDLRRAILRENADDPDVLALERSIAICNGETPDLIAAEKYARQALAIARQPAPALRQLAHVQRLRGDWKAAFQTYAQLFGEDPPEWAAQLAGEYVQTLEECRAKGLLGTEGFEEALKELDAALESDPTVALARARLDLSSDDLNPELGISRAWRKLENYRQFTDYEPLEILAPGSTRLWADFYLECDPERALRFITEELVRMPDSLIVWETYSHVLENQWDPVRSYSELEPIARMLPSSVMLRKLAVMAMRAGRKESEVRTILDRAKVLEGRPGMRDGQSYYLYARTLLNRSTNPGDRVVEYATALWTNKDVAKETVSIVEIARLYATALLLRDEEGDREEARTVLERVKQVEVDPYRRSTVEAMAGLARMDPGPAR